MSDDMLCALQISHAVACLYENSSHQLWLPHLSWSWLGAAPRTFISEEKSTLAVEEMMDMDAMHSPESQEILIVHAPMPAMDTGELSEKSRQGMVKRYGTTNASDEDLAMSVPLVQKAMINVDCTPVYRFTWRHFYLALPWAWGTPFALRIRLRISKALKSIKHSSHLRHALKNTVGVALLSIPAFLPPDSKGRWLSYSSRYILNRAIQATNGSNTCTGSG